jgi:SAM-dependent methyltransferase
LHQENQRNHLMNFFRKLFFQIWYLRHPPWDTNQTPPEVYDFLAANPPGRALDLGCGTGTNAITLTSHGWQVVGVDFVGKAIRTARRKAARAGVKVDFHLADVTLLPGIEGEFDLVLDIGCFQSLDPAGMAAYRRRINQLLAPGGYFMIYLFFKPENASSGSGASEADLIPFADFLELRLRQDGTERGIRKSSWLTFQKPG